MHIGKQPYFKSRNRIVLLLDNITMVCDLSHNSDQLLQPLSIVNETEAHPEARVATSSKNINDNLIFLIWTQWETLRFDKWDTNFCPSLIMTYCDDPH